MTDSSADRGTNHYRTTDRLAARIRLHTEFNQCSRPWQQWVFDQFSLPASASVLELGGGTGALWVENRERLSPRWEIWCTDASPAMVQTARAALSTAAPTFSFDVVDATQLPFADAGFDCGFDSVIANHMLYHVEERARALAGIRRVLKPGGRLYATTVGRGHMRELWALIEQLSPGVTAWTRRDVAGFTLENGERQLAAYFSQVSLKRYRDTLRVTEVEPPIAYVQSAIEGSRFALSDLRLTAFRRSVRQRLEHQGHLQITKDVGLFTAVGPE